MKNVLFPILPLFILIGCASTNRAQDHDLEKWESQKILQKEKSAPLGMVLGILPGGGSFYTGQYVWGVVDLLAWPFSILWDPAIGYQGANFRNWEETKIYTDKLEDNKNAALGRLDDLSEAREMDPKTYRAVRREIVSMPLKEFEMPVDLDSKISEHSRAPASVVNK